MKRDSILLPDESFPGLWKGARIVFENKLPDSLNVSFKIATPIELTDVEIKYFPVSCRHFGLDRQRIFTNKLPLIAIEETQV